MAATARPAAATPATEPRRASAALVEVGLAEELLLLEEAREPAVVVALESLVVVVREPPRRVEVDEVSVEALPELEELEELPEPLLPLLTMEDALECSAFVRCNWKTYHRRS